LETFSLSPFFIEKANSLARNAALLRCPGKIPEQREKLFEFVRFIEKEVGAGIYASLSVLEVGIVRKHDDLGRIFAFLDGLQGKNPIVSRQTDVQNDDIGFKVSDRTNGRLGTACLSHDLKGLDFSQEITQARTEDLGIIRDKKPHYGYAFLF
jgi:hypothetical protein